MINYSRASENNKAPILAQLRELFVDEGKVLEVGSGSGQHALHFAGALAHLTWQPTDQGRYFEGLVANLQAEPLDNVLAPLYLDVTGDWPAASFQYGLAANVLHIAAAELMAPFFAGFGECIDAGAPYVFMGPSNMAANLPVTPMRGLMSGLRVMTRVVVCVTLRRLRRVLGRVGLHLCETLACR